MNNHEFIRLVDGEEAEALVAPGLGGWLLRYARRFPGRGWEEALYWSQEVVDRYPREMYAGNPILFPLVSWNRVGGKEHCYYWRGRTWEMLQHGFARRLPWQVTGRTAGSLTLELEDDEGTRAVYPFPFRYRLSYRLEAGRLHWDQSVENLGSEPMPFSSGFHPYLFVPLTPDGRRTDCLVRLPGCRAVTPIGSWEGWNKTNFPARELSVSNPFEGTQFFTDLEEPQLSLIDPIRRLEIRLNFAEAPEYRFVALWTRSPGSPFFCLEPWTALPNSFSRKEDLILLEPGKVFRASLWLDIITL